MKRYYFLLGFIQAFTALGAIPAGLGYLLDPSGAGMGTSVKILENSPFSSFLIPGLFLLIVNGFGQAAVAWLSFARKPVAAKASIVLGVILILWIIMQVFWIGLTHFLQPFFFIVGIIEAGTGWYLLRDKDITV